MKQKSHMIKKNYSIPPLTGEVNFDELESIIPFIFEVIVENSFSLVGFSVSIFKENIEVSSNDDFAFKPLFSFLWKVECLNN